ncbi:MAG TPA: acireductone dioxygenase [Tahibacter sp.]|uniref:1,2-dihydroxy-3-keto-5-methylthiopentene dioxygenase n=1 Tax=Tahibacter sp. TaxID=2056211 RepID=UPI002CCE7D87|nr:acireductone dioxygenase [Tahibacter sp.]HSX59115.1 acireductone dioxygenase [Tahibacter sp.]
MSRLRIFAEGQPAQPLLDTDDHARIAAELGQVGVRFERWATDAAIEPGAAPETVIAAYRSDIDRLMQSEGYQAVDVISLKPDHPDKAQLRQKFLNEHTHSEDEVRFFVAGRGLFTLHVADKVYEVLCTQGDLIGVPDGTPHWFDMSEQPYFVAIRLFTNKEGWVANFTGSDIAGRFARLDA